MERKKDSDKGIYIKVVLLLKSGKEEEEKKSEKEKSERKTKKTEKGKRKGERKGRKEKQRIYRLCLVREVLLSITLTKVKRLM